MTPEAQPASIDLSPYIMAISIFSYLVVSGAIWSYHKQKADAEEKDFLETPVPFFTGLFWPLSLPIALGWFGYKMLSKRQQ